MALPAQPGKGAHGMPAPRVPRVRRHHNVPDAIASERLPALSGDG
jgi:hypothetical protein